MRLPFLLMSLALGPIQVQAADAWSPSQRSFPTGSAGSSVTYVDTAGIGHPTSCVVTLSAGLPSIGLSLNIMANTKVTAVAVSQIPFPSKPVGADVGIRVGTSYLFGKVTGSQVSGSFHVVNAIIEDASPGDAMTAAYKAIGVVVREASMIAVVADDAPVGAATIPAQPGIADAIQACHKYVVDHPHP